MTAIGKLGAMSGDSGFEKFSFDSDLINTIKFKIRIFALNYKMKFL